MNETSTSTRTTILDFSPGQMDDFKENNVPVLSLIQFSKAPFVTFGTFKLGTSKSAVLRIENPDEDVEAEVTVEKIPSSKGFSVDHRSFTIQPEGFFNLTVTWTPTDEGGIRELITFSANGVLKHQAVMLGRAEAPKKKKKSLWDTIKSKKGGERVGVSRGKKPGHPAKITVNKTFQVSREPHYKRDKPRSPQASLSKGEAARERVLVKSSIGNNSEKSEKQKPLNPKVWQQCLPLTDQENVLHFQRNSPVVLLVPATKVLDSGFISASPDVLKPENKNILKVLNKTISPIGTPERFKKLIPYIESESTGPPMAQSAADANCANSDLAQNSAFSLSNALALIDSELSQIETSPGESSFLSEFSDSLESKSDSCVLKEFPNIPESNEPRLTFFINKKVESNKAVYSVKENVVSKSPKTMVKKARFTSTTVTKSKGPVEENSLSERKIKKSRRRLLEKTLELDSSSQHESGPDTPKLPVILSDSGNTECLNTVCDDIHQLSTSNPAPCINGSPTPITFPLTSPPLAASHHFSFSVNSPPCASPQKSSSRLHFDLPSTHCEFGSSCPTVPAPLAALEHVFPVQIVAKTKKRKSEEYLKSDPKMDTVRADRVKRSKVVTVKTQSSKSMQEKRAAAAAQRQQPRAAGSNRSTASSLKSYRASVPMQTKNQSTKPVSRVTTSVKSSSSIKMSRVVAVAQSKLTFVKPTQTAIPRHPMPFAAKNMFFDERWIEKQERGFTWWINYVLTPDDFRVNIEVAKVNAVSLAMGTDDNFSVPKAPTKEEVSFSTYTARRKLNRLRRSACQLFTSETMVKAIQRLELEVESRRLLVRKDRHLWKDIGERQKLLKWLLSYNPLWLRIGLETIFGELISLESNSDVLGLAMFILQRLLWNADIAAEFRHAKVPHLYKEGHEEALSRFTLKKLLLLVCFLDKAKESRLIEHDPCLFCVDAEFKTSKDLLLAFSRDFLSGEGILPRHLGYLGLPVSHAQKPLDEFDFAVKNLAVDLRCGIRLVRVMELLTQDWSLSPKLRLPAISRLQKVHNTDVALQVLKSKGVDLKDEQGTTIDSRDIVDGHREKTLSLLWKIIFAFHVEVILDENQLREEITFLRRTLRTKQRLESLRADHMPRSSPTNIREPYEHSSTKISLLMDWARAVCDFYSLKVENFTVTFSDGRILCHLIHHYHPGLLPEEAVSHSTTQTMECSLRGRLELSCSASDSDSSFDSVPPGLNGTGSPLVLFKELLENERNNFRLVNTAVAYLGGVPAMINPADMSNTIPNEKVVMSYLTFLCARLLDLRNETRAARVIQGAWRKYRLKKDLQVFKERNMAAVKIQLLVRRFLQRRRAVRQNQAALVIQSLWRGHVTRVRLRRQKEARIRTLQHRAATIIQARWRMFSTLRSYQHLRYHAIIVQAQWRMKMAACAYGKLYWAAAVLQTRWRALVVARRERERYLSLRATVRKLQSGYRRWKAFKSEKENNAARMIQGVFRKWYGQRMAHRSAAAATIQSWYRMQKCLCQYRKIKKSALLIQALYRGHAQRRRFEAAKLQQRSAVILQRAFRGHAVRKQVARMRSAAVLIQRWFRAIVRRDKERQEFVRLRSAAVTIQAAYRGNVARAFVKKQQKAALAIQAAFRRYAAQSRYISMRKAAVVIQQKYRAYILARKTLKDFVALRYAVVIIQSNWRGRADRKKIKYRHSCATVIKAHYRRHKMQSEYRAKKAAAVIIQRQYRAFAVSKKTREAFMCERKACITLQAAFRGMRTRVELRRKHQAATIIQSTFRKFSCRNQYILLQSASFVIQSRYRALLLCRTQQKEYRQLQQAAVKIQALYRGFRVREELKYRNKAARIIQAQFRMYRIRMIYLATKCAAIIVQERFRAQILRNQQLHKYRTMKSAAVTIQKVFRGHIVRRNVTEMHRAAAVIQRMFLVVRDRRRFLAVKSAASVCQRRYRALSVARKDRLDFLSKRRAATCLQAVYRGYKVRGQLRVQNMAAVTVQAHYRAYKQRSHYRRLRWAATVVQARYRASKAMRQEVYKLSAKRHATVMIQAAYRGMKCRQIMKQKSQAAGVIQRAYRAHCVRRQYLALRSSVLIIQRRYRATVTANEQVQKYQDLRNAVVALQAACRGRQVRKEVARWHQAATLIQSVFRRHREEVKFQAMRLSAVIIQRYYRACVLQRKDRENYLEVKHAAVVLQATFRGQRVRRDIAKMHKAVTLIQANFRRHRFRRQHWAACVLQHRFRAQRKRDVDVKNYQELRKAVISLQAAYRGRQVRKEVARWHQAATLIQSVFRRHREEVKFQAMRLSAVIIQRYYRACVLQRNDRENFLKVRDAAVVLQAAYRGLHVRRNIAKMHKSATVIQANFRRRKEQSHYRRQYWAACVLQKRFRAKKQKDLDSKHYQMTRDAAIVLQAAYRGMKTRRGIKRSHLAASIIQRALMAHCERRHYLTLKTAVLTIQRRYRANVASKKEMQKYRNIQSAAVTLQAACRGWQVRKEVTRWHQAATLIQSVFKRHREEVKFQAMRLSAVIIQRYYRACVLQREDRENFLKIRGAAVVLQAAFRGKHVRRNITKMHKAATLIQANFRRHKQQSQFRRQCWAAYVLQQRFRAQRERDVNVKNYQELRKAVISLQAAVRGFNSRRKFKQRHRCATVIQRAYREHCEHKHYMKLNSCVINIQRRYRATLVAKKQRTQYLEMHSAAVVLQAAYRGHQVRMEVTRWHRAAAVIQSQFRKHKEEVKFCAMRVAAIIIQRHYRSCVAQRKEREVFLRKRQSTIVLQAALRGWRVRREIGRQNRSAVVIQSHWRGAVQRVSFQRKRAAALTLQRRFKEMQWGRAERNNYTRMRKAAITLQIHFRAWRTRRQFQEAEKANRRFRFTSAVFHHLSAMKIQRALRAHWALESGKRQIHCVLTIQRWVRARQQRRRYLEDRRRVVVAQSMVRTWLAHRHKAAAVIQQAVRKFLLVKRQKRIREGIVKAQALWRGHRSRRLNDNPMVVKLRHRLREVTDTAREEDKLCNKTSSSLDYLLKCKHMSYILEALKNLETATRLSPECCERLVNSGATNTIFTLIRCCNRSVPCMDMITFSIQILLNLSKYHKTIEAVYCVDKSVETLLDLLQRYREKAGDKVADKGGSIFTKACFLVALLLQDKGRAVEVMKLPKASDRISSIYRLTARKHKMDAERTVIKQKMNASINGSFLVQATPRKSRTAPKFAPDWVLKKDKLKDIVDPLRAIQMVADTLSIVL